MNNGLYVTRRLRDGERIPFKLLLLADEELQAIERYIYQSDIYVLEHHHQTIGVYALFKIDDRAAEIKAIAVDEAYQNQGIGKFMLTDAAVKARKYGCRELIIGTPTVAEKQLTIYRKAGFDLFEIRKDYFIKYYCSPIFENGVQLKDMAMLKKCL